MLTQALGVVPLPINEQRMRRLLNLTEQRLSDLVLAIDTLSHRMDLPTDVVAELRGMMLRARGPL